MKKIIIPIIIIVLIVAGFIVFSLSNKKETREKEKQPGLEETEEIVEEELTEREKKEISLDALKSKLSIEARSFVGRYYSYSADSGYYNLKNLLPLMSEEMALATRQKIAQGLPDNGFFSYVFNPYAVNLIEFKEGVQVVFLVQGQEQVKNNQESNLIQREVEIVFILEKDQWKVDKIKYQE